MAFAKRKQQGADRAETTWRDTLLAQPEDAAFAFGALNLEWVIDHAKNYERNGLWW